MEKTNTLKDKRSKTLTRTKTNSAQQQSDTIEKINLNDFDIGSKIGKGSYGICKICKQRKLNRVYCMKILKKADLLQSKIVEHLQNEYSIMSTIFHPFIVEMKGINNTDSMSLNFLFEYVPGGELSTYLQKKVKLTIDEAKFYIASIVTALDYLHKKNIIYRDIKPENILINSNGYIKLNDFSFAKQLKSDQTFTLCGTPEYCAPEMINKSGHGKPVDYWSLGIVLYEMLMGTSPFFDNDPTKIYQKINKGKINFPKDLENNVKLFIKHLLILDPKKRLGSEGIVNIIDHPFFSQYDWKGLLFRNLTPPFIPDVSGPMDISNYKKYEDDYFDEPDTPINPDKDPFYNW